MELWDIYKILRKYNKNMEMDSAILLKLIENKLDPVYFLDNLPILHEVYMEEVSKYFKTKAKQKVD